MTSKNALELLKEGNQRFVENKRKAPEYYSEIKKTSGGQSPFAVVLGCIDSRVPHEIIFDLGIGDIFSIRVAGNIINDDILGSMEFACKVIGSKHILVLGHTKCGAVAGAMDGAELGHLTGLLEKIRPAIDTLKKVKPMYQPTVDDVVRMNVNMVVEKIKQKSEVLTEMLKDKTISVSGAVYDVASGHVEFLED